MSKTSKPDISTFAKSTKVYKVTTGLVEWDEENKGWFESNNWSSYTVLAHDLESAMREAKVLIRLEGEYPLEAELLAELTRSD